jgi:hypothetical protein
MKKFKKILDKKEKQVKFLKKILKRALDKK